MDKNATQMTSPFAPLLPALLACLQEPDDCDWLTWHDLWDTGYCPTAAAEAILHILAHHPSADLRWKAAEFLGRLGRTVRGAIPALYQALQDETAAVRQEVASALGRLAAQEATPALQMALNDRHPDVRREAAEALFFIDPAAILTATPTRATTLHLLQQLHSGDFVTQFRAIMALANSSYASHDVVLALLRKLRDKSWYIQEASENTLKALGEAAVPFLHELLTAPDLATREQATAGLQCLGPAAAPAAATLVRSLESIDFAIPEHRVAEALRAMRRAALPYLLEALEQRPSEKIAQVLREVWPPTDAIEPLLSNPNDDVRYWALQAVRDVTPALSLLLHDPSERIRKKVVETLGKTSDLGPEGEAALIQALHDPAPTIRDLAQYELSRRALAPLLVVPLLIERLHAPDAKEREEALEALAQYGEAARDAVPALAAQLHDSNMAWRYHSALRKIGPTAAAAVPVLISLLENADPVVRRDATETLELLGQTAQAAVPTLLAAIHDRRTVPRPRNLEAYETDEDRSAQAERNVLQARLAAIAVFAKLAPDIQTAAVFECLQDPAVAIRWAACRALWRRGVRTPEMRAVLLHTLPVWLQQDIQYARWTAYEKLEEVLQELELHGPEWHGALCEWQQYPDPEVRWAACCALWKRGVRTSEFKASLLHSVSPKVYTTLEMAVWTLGELAPTDPDFIRVCIYYLADSDRKVRESARFSLAKAIGAEAEYWLACVSHPDAQLRCKTVIALGQLWPSEDILQAVLAACQDADPEVRMAAVQALGNLGLTAPKEQEQHVIVTLANALADDRAAMRLAAAESLADLGEAAKLAVPDLLHTLQDPSEEVRRVVALALYRLAPSAAAAAGVPPPQRLQPRDIEEDVWLEELSDHLAVPRRRTRRGRGKRRP